MRGESRPLYLVGVKQNDRRPDNDGVASDDYCCLGLADIGVYYIGGGEAIRQMIAAVTVYDVVAVALVLGCLGLVVYMVLCAGRSIDE